MKERKFLLKENESLKMKNDRISNDLESEKVKRKKAESELKETKEELINLMRKRIKD